MRGVRPAKRPPRPPESAAKGSRVSDPSGNFGIAPRGQQKARIRAVSGVVATSPPSGGGMASCATRGGPSQRRTGGVWLRFGAIE